MSAIIRQQKPPFGFYVKLVKFQSLVSKCLRVYDYPQRVGLPREPRGKRPAEDCDSLVFTRTKNRKEKERQNPKCKH